MSEQTTLHIKINNEQKEKFEQICKDKYQTKHTNMFRELITAFNEGRLTIKPSDGQLNLFTDVYKGE